MALRFFGLLFLQTVAAVPTHIHRNSKSATNTTTCPTANGTVVDMGGKSWSIECGIDTYMGDMPAPNGQHTASFDDCIKSCVDRSGCQAVAWLNKDACYLKGSIPQRLAKASVWGAVLAQGNSSVTATSTITYTATVTATGSGETENTPAAAATTTSAVASSAVASFAVASSSSAAAAAAASSAAPSFVQAAVDFRHSSAAIPKASSAAPAPAASYQSSAASPAASTSPSTGSGSCSSRPAAKQLSTKRGVPYNSASLVAPFSGKVSWAYNWGASPGGTLPSGVQYIPMLWSSNSPGSWTTNAQTAIDNGADVLLGDNEPDNAGQSNLDVATAVAGWKQYMEPFACKARLAAPAVTNGGPPVGLTWLESFLSACTGCTIDVVPIHWYDSATNIDYFKSYVQSAYTAGGNRPLWITEFGASGTDAEIESFFQTVIPWLDEQAYVERYSYFYAATGSLVSSATALSAIGQAYVSN